MGEWRSRSGSAVGVFDEASRDGWGAEDNTYLPAYWLKRTQA